LWEWGLGKHDDDSLVKERHNLLVVLNTFKSAKL
jgi:hypothetical protein